MTTFSEKSAYLEWFKIIFIKSEKVFMKIILRSKVIIEIIDFS